MIPWPYGHGMIFGALITLEIKRLKFKNTVDQTKILFELQRDSISR